MKNLLQKIIQQRNPKFQFDEHITTSLLMELMMEKGIQFLRSFKLLLGLKMPKKLFLGRGVRFFNLSKIELGQWVKLEDFVYLSALGTGKLKIGNRSGIGAHSRVIVSTSFNNLGSHIYIGENVGIGEFAYLGGGGGLTIGDDCIVGQYFSCHPENHNYEDSSQKIREQGVNRKGIEIGENCWIGSKVTILDGVKIGNNCIIAAGSVVNKSFPSNVIIGGVPAKILKQKEARIISLKRKKEVVV